MVYFLSRIFLVLGLFLHTCLPSRVLELTDRFPEIRKDGGIWLVKFYAPWCGHCKKLEPLWMHVAQALTRTNIKVGRVDVTRFPNVANEFKAYATPTIKFIKPNDEHTYVGERSKEAILNYALRMAGAPVQEVRQADSVAKLRKRNQIFFMYVGKREGHLWDLYFMAASSFQPHAFFYSISEDLSADEVPVPNVPAVYVHKEGEHSFFQKSAQNYSNSEVESLNSTLHSWINEERFEIFPKITSENIKEIMKTGKFIVLAIVEENKAKHISSDMLEFRNRFESLIRKKRHLYHKFCQFGWMGNTDFANSILMERISAPYLLVLNSSTFHHHVPEEDPLQMSNDAIEAFLETIINRTSPSYGGNSLHINVVRRLFDFKRNIEDMWKGNPVLLMVLFTLPSVFFLLIMWTCCCADILDADDNDDDEDFHEKKD